SFSLLSPLVPYPGADIRLLYPNHERSQRGSRPFSGSASGRPGRDPADDHRLGAAGLRAGSPEDHEHPGRRPALEKTAVRPDDRCRLAPFSLPSGAWRLVPPFPALATAAVAGGEADPGGTGGSGSPDLQRRSAIKPGNCQVLHSLGTLPAPGLWP